MSPQLDLFADAPGIAPGADARPTVTPPPPPGPFCTFCRQRGDDRPACAHRGDDAPDYCPSAERTPAELVRVATV